MRCERCQKVMRHRFSYEGNKEYFCSYCNSYMIIIYNKDGSEKESIWVDGRSKH